MARAVGQVVGVVGVPDAAAQPGGEHVLGNELFERGDRRAAVIAALADEVRGGLLVEVVLEVGARAPVVLLGHQVALDALGNVGRGGQEHAGRVVQAHHAGQYLAGERVVTAGGAGGFLADKGLVALVVARPQQDRGVIAQLAHHLGRFLLQRVDQPGHVRIGAAGHREILPDQDAVSVAQVEELVILVDVAAPAAHDVAARVLKQRKRRGHAFGVPAVHRVHGHPVAAHQHHRRVDHLELALVARLHHLIDHDRAQADGLLEAVHDLALAQQLQLHAVQVLLAVIARPPQLCVRDIHVQRAGDEQRGLFDLEGGVAAGAGQAHGKVVQRERVRLIAEAAHELRRAVGVDPAGDVVGLGQAGFAPLDQAHAAPHAGRQEPGHDVPAEAGRGHAQQRVAVLVVVAGDADRNVHFARLVDRRTDAHGEHVLLAVIQRVGHVELVLDQHVVARADALAVQENVGEGVQAVKAQDPAIAGILGRVERALEPPLIKLVLAEGVDVFRVEGVLLQARAHQIQLHVAGHLRADLRPGKGAELIGRLRHDAVFHMIAQRPFSVQGKRVHGQSSFFRVDRGYIFIVYRPGSPLSIHLSENRQTVKKRFTI